jgi:hypothetical protein
MQVYEDRQPDAETEFITWRDSYPTGLVVNERRKVHRTHCFHVTVPFHVIDFSWTRRAKYWFQSLNAGRKEQHHAR